MSTPFPVVRLELQGMRHTVMHALAQRSSDLSLEIRAALDAAMTDENIQAEVNRAVQRELNEAINEEVRRFFTSGDGRKMVADAVCEKLRA